MTLKLPFLKTAGLGLMASLLSTAAIAEVPRVATDIAPVHSLVAMVMGDLGAPALIVRPEASPHGYAMRPSEAQALSDADLVVWIGEALTPWLEGPLETLAGGAHKLELMSVEGTVLHDYREGATFAAHDHGDHEGHDHGDHDDEHDHDDAHDDDAHDDHGHAHDDDHGHAAEKDGHDHAAEQDDHDHAHDDHGDGHDHSGADAHAWLDPVNGRLWLGAIAAELSELDPENAAAYAANAAAGQAELEALEERLRADLAGLGEAGFVVFHDAYQYFERRFGLSASGAISMSDATTPSAGRIAELQEAVGSMGVACVFSEPQFNAGLINSVFADRATVGILDPLGFDIAAGPGLYPQILKTMAAEFVGCLAG